MLNNLIIMGRLTAEPEVKASENSEYCRFSIAVDRPKKKGEEKAETDFFNCISWNGVAKIISKYYHKGDTIVLGGHLRNNRYEKDGKTHTVTEIFAREIHFTNEKKSDRQELPPEVRYTEENPPF